MSSRVAFLALIAIALPAPRAVGAADAERPATSSKATRAVKSGKTSGTKARATPPARAGAGTSQASAFKLKPGANGSICLECHADFADRLAKASVHTPVRARDCTACHNPHAASHPKLLSAEPAAVCANCHADFVPKEPKSAHKPVADGKCTACHDPHASAYKFNLVRGGNELCAGCHAAIGQQATNARRKHRPVEQGCTACHQPHGSPAAPALLKADVPGLCLGCHRVDSPVLAKKHMGYPVKQARCTSCHDPHGSDAPGILYANVHPPVAKAMCSMCHEPAGSATPLRTRKQGVALCRECHAPRISAMLDRNRVHQPVAEGSCLACHSPHASKQRRLVKANMVVTCGACHVDTIRRQELSPTKHKPIAQGECTSCHDPHSSNTPLMFVNANRIELCGSCHDWQRHSTHPIGEKKVDPRDRNLTLDCLSCHRAHGTDAKHMLPYAKVTDLCTNCHDKFRR